MIEMLRPAQGVFWRREDSAVVLVGPPGALRLSGPSVAAWDMLVAVNGGRTSLDPDLHALSEEMRLLGRQLVDLEYLEEDPEGVSWETSRLGHVPAMT